MNEQMNTQEVMDQVINEFVNLQRIKKASDREAEIEYQERILRAKLHSLGITTEDLELK